MITTIALRASALVALSLSAAAGTLYVDANLASGSNDGSSWSNAFQGGGGLQAALALAVAGDEIFVAQGTYLPTSTGQRFATFILESGVAIYGSFLGGESTPAERPPFGTAPSVLSGDLAGDDGSGVFGENSFHVLNGGGTDASAVLDGFTVTGGNANGNTVNFKSGGGIICVNVAGPTIRNCRFVLNRASGGGGAGYVNNVSGMLPSFTDCSFEDNEGGGYGGALQVNQSGALQLERCAFSRNRAGRGGAIDVINPGGAVVASCVFDGNEATGPEGGGALWISNGGSATLSNLTVVANNATGSAYAGLRVLGTSVSVANGIFWANTGPGGAQDTINQITGTSNVTYSVVMGGLAGPGNLSSDPLFVDEIGQDYALTLASPAVDAGENAAVPAGALLDLARSPRFVDEPAVPDTGAGLPALVDIGAFEFLRPIGTPDPGCSPLANSTGFPATLIASGSLAVADNALALLAGELPLNEFGYFVMSESTGSLPVASGVLCLGSPQYRFTSDILNSGGSGLVSFSPDMTSLPQGQVFSPGDTWYFQLWHRDGASSNFSSDLGFTWQ